MTSNEITWFVGLIIFGSTVGIVSGGIAVKSAKGLGTAIMGAILIGIIMPLILCFIAGFFEAHQPNGFSITNALLAGIGVMFFYGIGITILVAPASLLSSIASYAAFTKCMHKFQEQASPGQHATSPESKSEGGDKPQPEAEGRSR